MAKKVILLILDGWGVAAPSRGNAIYKANTPTIDTIEKSYFMSSLQASGIGVGLSWGQEGNSEVGHMNLGAGRIIFQYLPRIVESIRNGAFFKNKALKGAVDFVKRNNSTLHLMGLISTGSVHSYIDHLYALLDMAEQNNIERVVIHAFTDGKDGGPKEGANFIKHLQMRLNKRNAGKIGTVVGRAYAMDRNNSWELTEKAYNLLTKGVGKQISDPAQYIENSYNNGKTDLDIEPAVVTEGGKPVGLVQEGDALVFFNFREDSARQLTRAFVLPNARFDHFEREKIANLYFVGMTMYEEGLPIEVAFPPPKINMPMTEVISKAGLKQLHIAETEKYAHVTYFFNGEIEEPFEGEERMLIPSMGTPHYEKAPEMQAYNITQKVLENIENYDFFLINFANADLLAHSGNFNATVKGIEAMDANISSLVEIAKKYNISLVITADHGNAEEMMNLKTGETITKHSINPVPFYIVDEAFQTLNADNLYTQAPKGVLADVSPTILKIMGVDIPDIMTGQPLI
ncbi:MAG: 2,3-bisphosphoglycerate-independent phosphoglycerate mutase [Candidatus Spechtbacterales bacterium]|nr:2,3-bisphosphoglycerate-independent phosphoglycerate mutase [Candidatus Spechtbacterales bacterium]